MPAIPSEKKASKPRAKKAKAPPVRETVYPEFREERYVGDTALTVEESKTFIGWEEEPEGGNWGGDYFLKDLEGKKIRCSNNVHNRPLYGSNVDKLMDIHLRHKWEYNGEPIIVGKTAQVLNGQHSFIAHILAEQERTGKNAGQWAEFWQGPITMDKLVVFGVSEDDRVVNTMDTCKARSLSDVIYRSPYFSTKTGKDRLEISRVLDYAIKTLWHRTGYSNESFAPRKSHTEYIDFLEYHPKLLEAVSHVFEENQVEKKPDGKWPVEPISSLLGLGYSAALLYMMGCCTTDGDEYRLVRTEKACNWEYWDKACEFFVLLKDRSEETKAVNKAVADLIQKHGRITTDERMGIMAKAWLTFAANGKVTPAPLKLKYSFSDKDGSRSVSDIPDVGGIDLGDPEEDRKERERTQKEQDDAAGEKEGEDPTPEEIEAAKEEQRLLRAEEEKEKEEAKKAARAAKRAAARAAKNGNGGAQVDESSQEDPTDASYSSAMKAEMNDEEGDEDE